MRKGELWERKLEAWHLAYAKAGLAILHRCHPAVRQSGRRWFYEDQGPPDFVGMLRGGHHIVFDAKTTENPSGKLPYKNIEPHQAFAFGQTLRLGGGGAFLAVQTVTGEWWVPWLRIGDDYARWARKEPGAASFDPAQKGDRIGPDGWLDFFKGMY